MPKPGNPFVVPGMDPELAELINVHRGLFGGFTMTAPPAEPPAQTPAEPAATQQPPATPAAPQAPTPPTPGSNLPDDVEALKAMIADLRKENASSRSNAKQQAADDARNSLVQELGKALGLVKDDPPADPKALQAQIATIGGENTSLKTQAQAAETRQAALLAAITAGANPVALLDSNSFLKSIEGLAPTDTEKITAAITAAISTNPSLKAAPVAPKSGPEINGGTGGQGKPTNLEEAIAAKLGAQN